MIYVVEIPHQGQPRAWFAFDQDDFVRKVRAEKVAEYTLFSAETPRRQLQAAGYTPEAAGARTLCSDIFELADRHGWDTVLYRADGLLGHGVYRLEPVSEFEACVGAIAESLLACRVYLSDAAATAALYRDPLYDGREGFHAHMALREQLIAMEAISDDL